MKGRSSSEKRQMTHSETNVSSIEAPIHGPTSVATVTAVVLVLIAVRLAASAFIPLAPDETYYLEWSRYPSWSYYDHPPMGAWWIAVGTALFGENPFGIRFIGILSAIPTTLAMVAAGRILFDQATALRAALWTNATFLIAVGGLLATPDAPSVMFWSFAVLALAYVWRTGNGVWWLLVGLFAGLGVASKLTGLFIGPAILLCLGVVRDLRRWVLSPWLWAGGLIAALVLVPMALWNADHNWVTLSKQFGRVSAGGAFRPEGPLDFLGTQFGVLNPLLGIFVGLAVVMVLRNRTAPRVPGMTFLLWTTAPIVAYMAIHSFHEQIQGHWLAPIFPTLALVAAAAAETAGQRWAPLASLVLPLGVGGMLIGFIAAANPGNIIPPNMDIGQVIRGWDTLADETNALRKQTGATWIATTHYAYAAELNYHLRTESVPVIEIFERDRYAFAPAPDPTLLQQPALIITGSPITAFAPCFASLKPVGIVQRRTSKATYESFPAYLAEGASPGIFSPGCDRLP